MKNVRLPNGLTIAALNTTEPDVLYHEIFAMQSYQQHGITIADGSCIFDIDANIGLYSLFLTQPYRNLRLFAFEPIPALFSILQQNAQLLFPTTNAQLQNVALSDHPGTAQFTFNPSLGMAASMYPAIISQSAQKQAMVYNIRNRYLAEGLTVALSEKPRPGQPSKFDKAAQAHLTALACS